MYKYFGHIESIKDEWVGCQLKKVDEDNHYGLYFWMDIPKKMIPIDKLKLGQCFWINNPETLEIEWCELPIITKEQIEEAWKKAEELSKKLKWK